MIFFKKESLGILYKDSLRDSLKNSLKNESPRILYKDSLRDPLRDSLQKGIFQNRVHGFSTGFSTREIPGSCTRILCRVPPKQGDLSILYRDSLEDPLKEGDPGILCKDLG